MGKICLLSESSSDHLQLFRQLLHLLDQIQTENKQQPRRRQHRVGEYNSGNDSSLDGDHLVPLVAVVEIISKRKFRKSAWWIHRLN